MFNLSPVWQKKNTASELNKETNCLIVNQKHQKSRLLYFFNFDKQHSYYDKIIRENKNKVQNSYNFTPPDIKKNTMKPSTLILGIGNDILMDDGIGPRLVQDMKRLGEFPDTKYEVICSGGLDVMEYIKGFQKVIFIDAIRTENGNPGDVYYFKSSQFRETMHLSSLHDVSFLTALELGNNLDLGLSSDIHIIAVEIIEDRQFGNELTPELQVKYPEINKKVLSLITEIIK